MTKVTLNGILGAKFGNEWKLKINSIQEIVRAIDANRGNFKKFLVDSKGLFYKIIVNGKVIKTQTELYGKFKEAPETIELEPIFIGALSKDTFGIIQIVVGSALLAGGIALAATGVGTAFAPALILGGLSLLATGVITLLTPTPDFDNQDKAQGTSSIFGDIGKTSGQGFAIPLIYGELVVEGFPIATSIRTEDDSTQHGEAIYRPNDSGGGKK